MLQITFRLRFIFHGNTHYGARTTVGCVFGLEQAGHDALSRMLFHKIHPLFIPLLDIIGISSFGIFLPRSKAEHGFQIRNGPLVVEESRGRKPLSRKPLYRHLPAKRVDKRPGSIRTVTDTGTIHGFLIELHIELRPASQACLRTDAVRILSHAHLFHAHVHRCRHIIAFAGIHGTERRHIHQRLPGTAGIDDLLYQTLLKADRQKIRREIDRKETSVRHGIDTYFLAVIIEVFRGESTGAVLTHKRFHQFVISRAQAAIQHLIQRSIRLVKTDKHLVHLPAQPVRSVAYQRIEILFQVGEKLRNI